MKKKENINNIRLHGLKGQHNLAQGLSVGETALTKEKMTEASNVYRKTDLGIGSTPLGSNIFHPNIFYKHTNPLGL